MNIDGEVLGERNLDRKVRRKINLDKQFKETGLWTE